MLGETHSGMREWQPALGAPMPKAELSTLPEPELSTLLRHFLRLPIPPQKRCDIMRGLQDQGHETMEAEITRLLAEAQGGYKEAQSRLASVVYDELHRLAARCMYAERPFGCLAPGPD